MAWANGPSRTGTGERKRWARAIEAIKDRDGWRCQERGNAEANRDDKVVAGGDPLAAGATIPARRLSQDRDSA